MPKFGKRSMERLEGVDERLVVLLNEAVKHLDMTILCGVRSQAEQAELVRRGMSKTLNSKHLTGHAVDVALWPLAPEDWTTAGLPKWYYLQGFLQGIHSQQQRRGENGGAGWTLRSGVNWSGGGIENRDLFGFVDGPHIEIIEQGNK